MATAMLYGRHVGVPICDNTFLQVLISCFPQLITRQKLRCRKLLVSSNLIIIYGLCFSPVIAANNPFLQSSNYRFEFTLDLCERQVITKTKKTN